MASKDTAAIADESITYTSGADLSTPPALRFLHYNDVYHVEPGSREPVGGIARFQTLCNSYRSSIPDSKYAGQSDLLTFFSGDAFNPSLESSVTKGKHMIAPLNDIGTDVACLGNHDLDFGVEQFEFLKGKCRFSWLCANVLDPALGEHVPIARCRRTEVLTASNGIRVGVIGVVEREWLDTINSLPPDLKYLSATAVVRELAGKLREEEKVEMVVVVSHQREPNDLKLARNLEAGVVDLVLGGHDHYYAHHVDEGSGVHVLRSGSDFKQLSYIEARRKVGGGKGWDFDITRRDVVSSVPQDQAAVEMVEKITASLRPKLEKPIGYTSAPLDARFTTVRTKESNLGNFTCDLMRFHYNADCAIMASGTIRGDQVYPPGVLRVKDMMNCFPFEDPCVVIALKGSQIVEALENGVKTYPALEGRFPQVSGIEFTFDASKEPGQRCSDIKIGEKPVDVDKEYTLATRDYMVRGKDGFTSLMLEGQGGSARSIVSDENGMLISMILHQYFMSLKVLGKWKLFGKGMSGHWGKIHGSLHKSHPILDASPVAASTANTDKITPAPSVSQDEQVHTNGEARESLVDRAQNHSRQGSDLAHRPSKSRKLKHEECSTAAAAADSDSEDEHDLPEDPIRERELYVMRKVMRKWCRLAGLHGKSEMCAQKGEDFAVAWTRGIAPRLEGRIKIVGAAT